ncbi:MAG: CDP-diacylglycerol--glycerol-3-phosphate 3-phosphatidyltransferase [Acidobacteriota bacterium]
MNNLPNLLTVGRILLVPILVTVLFTKVPGKEWVGLGLFLAAALTDFLDGFLARRWRQVTRLGQLLDPAADKILMASAFVSLIELEPEVTPAWMVAVILAREFAVGALRNVAASDGHVIAAGWAGKIKTVVQIVAISLLIIHAELGEFRHLAPISLWIAVVVTVYSGVDYFLRYRRVLARAGTSGGATAA